MLNVQTISAKCTFFHSRTPKPFSHSFIPRKGNDKLQNLSIHILGTILIFDYPFDKDDIIIIQMTIVNEWRPLIPDVDLFCPSFRTLTGRFRASVRSSCGLRQFIGTTCGSHFYLFLLNKSSQHVVGMIITCPLMSLILNHIQSSMTSLESNSHRIRLSWDFSFYSHTSASRQCRGSESWNYFCQSHSIYHGITFKETFCCLAIALSISLSI